MNGIDAGVSSQRIAMTPAMVEKGIENLKGFIEEVNGTSLQVAFVQSRGGTCSGLKSLAEELETLRTAMATYMNYVVKQVESCKDSFVTLDQTMEKEIQGGEVRAEPTPTGSSWAYHV